MLSSCLRYAFSEAVGFPLVSSRADVLALWPGDCWAARREPCWVFLILLAESESNILQCDASSEEVGVGGILGNRRERKRKELHLCVLILGVKNQCVLRLYCTVLRNSRDRQVTRRLLAAEGCYMGGEAVSAVRPGIKTQSAVALSFCILSQHTGLKVEEGPHLRVQGISWRTNKRQTGRHTWEQKDRQS